MTKGLEGNFRKRDHFGFEFHCKPIVAMHGIAKALLCKTFAVAKRIDAREMKPRHSPACVFSGMIASTCLAVLFVPTFFVVVQRFENWLTQRKRRTSDAPTISPAES
jgi:hypothetical protein